MSKTKVMLDLCGTDSATLTQSTLPENCVTNAQNLFFENLITYKQAAQYLGVSETYLRRLKAQGKIPWVQIGGRGVRFRVRSLIRWIDEREIA